MPIFKNFMMIIIEIIIKKILKTIPPKLKIMNVLLLLFEVKRKKTIANRELKKFSPIAYFAACQKRGVNKLNAGSRSARINKKEYPPINQPIVFEELFFPIIQLHYFFNKVVDSRKTA